MAGKIVELPISDIKVDFYVRQSLSEEHVLALGMLFEANEQLPPIIVNEEYQVIDGRHRLKAADMVGRTHIHCEIRRGLERGEQILTALTENMGGSLPPKPADIRLAIQNMLNAGMKPLSIRKGLPLPPSVATRYISDAQSAMSKQRITAAIEAVTEFEMSVKDAAEKFNIDVEELRVAIRGKKKKTNDDALGLPKIKSALSSRYRSCSQHNAKMFDRLMNAFMDGECSEKIINETFDITEKMIMSQASNVNSWRQRLLAVKRNAEA